MIREPSPVEHVLRLLAVFVVAFGIGWIFEGEEYVAIWIAMGVPVLALLWHTWRSARGAWWHAMTDVPAAGVGFILGFWLGRGEWWYFHRVVRWMLLAMPLLPGLVSLLAHGGANWMRPRRLRGTNCPACGYSLIGVTEHRCPECGRSFTLRELRITEADLAPAGTESRSS